MKLEYYADSDTLYIELSEGVSPVSGELAPDIVLDYGEHGQVIGIAIDHASNLTNLSQLAVLGFPMSDFSVKEKMPTSQQA